MYSSLIGIVIGGALGFGYHKLVGCASGACPLTANPWIATIYGAVIGLFLGSGRFGG